MPTCCCSTATPTTDYTANLEENFEVMEAHLCQIEG